MSKHAQLADGTILEFPDDTPDDVMDTAVKNHVIKEQQAEQFPTATEMNARGVGNVYNRKPGAMVYPGEKDYLPLDQTVTQGVSRMASGAANLASGVYHAAVDPNRPDESNYMPFTGRFLKRTVVDPMSQERARTKDPAITPTEQFGHAVASGVPVVGPAAASMSERAASGQLPEVMGELTAAWAAGKGASAFKEVTKNAAADIAPRLYQKALQPSPRGFSLKEIDALVNTGLKHGLSVSRSGLNKLDSLVNRINTSIEADIATNPDAPISPTAVTRRLGDARTKASIQVNPESDVNAINSAGAEFLRQHQIPGPTNAFGVKVGPATDIPIKAVDAQAIKKGTYRQINAKDYGELGSGAVEGQKQLARGLKEELETYFPEIKAKNAAEGELLDLRPELEVAVNRLGNRRISLSNVFNLMADPTFTSRIATALYKAGLQPKAVASRINKYTLGIQAMAVAAANRQK